MDDLGLIDLVLETGKIWKREIENLGSLFPFPSLNGSLNQVLMGKGLWTRMLFFCEGWA